MNACSECKSQFDCFHVGLGKCRRAPSTTMDDATTLDTDRPHQTFQLKPQKFNNFGTTTLPEYFQQNVHIWTSCSPIWIDFLSANSLPLQGNNIVLFGQKPRRVAGFFFSVRCLPRLLGNRPLETSLPCALQLFLGPCH